MDARRMDRRLFYGAAALRTFGFGFSSVLLGLYLKALGFGPFKVGLLFTLGLVGSALLTFMVSVWADRIGRRRVLVAIALATVLGALAVALWPRFGVLLAITLLGALNPTGKDRGAFAALEQSALPQAGEPAERNWTFARYNLVGTIAGAVGALAAGVTTLLQRWGGLSEVDSFRAMFILYSALALALAALYTRLSPAVELEAVGDGRMRVQGARSRRIIAGLSGLFALDAFGGGLVIQSFLAYWFNLKFGLSAHTLGTIFFASGVLSSLSFLVAARLAQRIGLLRTMVFTHLPSNVLIIFVPLAPTAWGALTLFLVREALSQMDVPTRQSYTVAVVAPEERTAAVGWTTLSRNAAQSVSPSLGGYLTQAVSASSPFLLAGLVKGFYDLALFFSFRRVKPPEEMGSQMEQRPLVQVNR